LDSLVDCYRHVFGGQDWKEWKVCGAGHKFSFSESQMLDRCPICGQPLKFYWPAAEVKEDILRDFNSPQSVFIIAVNETDKVVGFTWGYAMDKDSAQKKFDGHLPYKLLKLLKTQKRFWYQDEIGVAEDYRNLGLASRLYKKRMSLVLARYKHNHFIIRTQPTAKTYRWYQHKIGYRVLAKYYRSDIREWRYLLYADRQIISAYVLNKK
jgi:ribosomal protein S18 acetylase RimI-like enzyme